MGIGGQEPRVAGMRAGGSAPEGEIPGYCGYTLRARFPRMESKRDDGDEQASRNAPVIASAIK
jgi:hypothetical protein